MIASFTEASRASPVPPGEGDRALPPGLAAVMTAYEEQIRHPWRNLLTGMLAARQPNSDTLTNKRLPLPRRPRHADAHPGAKEQG